MVRLGGRLEACWCDAASHSTLVPGPRQPHKPRIGYGHTRAPGPGDYNPASSSIGRQLVSKRASGPSFTFGDPTIASREKLNRELALRDGTCTAAPQHVVKGIAMTQYLARPKSPRLSPRFPDDGRRTRQRSSRLLCFVCASVIELVVVFCPGLAVLHEPSPGPGAYQPIDSMHLSVR